MEWRLNHVGQMAQSVQDYSSVDGANASAICFTMIEMAKAYDLNVYKYLNFLLEKRPNARTAQKELEKLAPWNEEVQKMFARKMK